MVIQCPECSTKFKLSDDKIKPEGVRVRCAKCRHVFAVVPESSAEPVVPAPLAPAAPQEVAPEQESAEDPSSFKDLWGDFDGSPSAGEEDRRRELPDQASAEEETESEGNETAMSIDEFALGLDDLPKAGRLEVVAPAAESDDWDAFQVEEFTRAAEDSAASSEVTDEAPVPPVVTDEVSAEFEMAAEFLEDSVTEDELPAEAWSEEGVPEDSLSFEEEASDPADFSWGEMPEADSVDEPRVFEEEPPPDRAAVADSDEFSFAEESAEGVEVGLSLDAFSFEEEGHAATDAGGGDFSFTEDAADKFSFAESSSDDPFSFEETSPSSAGAENAEFSFGVGEASASGNAKPFAKATPGSDDFQFDGIGFDEEAVAAVPVARLEAEPVQLETPPVERSAPRKPEPPIDQPPAVAAAPKARRKSPLASLLRMFLLVLLGLVAVGGYLFWQSGMTDVGQFINQFLGHSEELESTAAQIRLPLPNSFFVMNRSAGQLFVVQGEAVNGYAENRSSIAIKGMLRDASAQVLMQQTVFCGNVLSQETLKTAPFAQIEEAMNNQFGNALSNLNIAPGKAIPYMIVFRNLPPHVTEFTIEVADSKPGGQQ